MNFFGLLTFKAPFLPWVLFGFSLMLGNSVMVDLIGKTILLLKLDHYMKKEIFPLKILQIKFTINSVMLNRKPQLYWHDISQNHLH